MNFTEHLASRYFTVGTPCTLTSMEEELVHFWLYNLSGELVGFQRYDWHSSIMNGAGN